MEIYFLHPKFNVLGGAEQVLLILCKELSLKGHVVKLITEEKYDFYIKRLEKPNL